MKSRQSWAELYALDVDRAGGRAGVPPDLPAVPVGHPVRRASSRRRSCRRRASLLRSSVCPDPQSSRPSNNCSPKAMPPAGRARGPTSPLIFPSLSAAVHGRRQRPASAVKTAASSRDVGDFIDVTVQSDERPFNLGRTLVDARTAELWRKLSARSLRSLWTASPRLWRPARHAGAAQVRLRLSPGRARRAMRARTDRDHRGHPASHRYRYPCHAGPGQGGLDRRSRILR